MAPGDTLVLTLVVAFVLAFALGMIALRLRMQPLVGYLLAGVVVGPFTPGVVADSHLARQLADIGIILLMFGVGLHFSPKDLLRVQRIAVPGALLQVALGAALGALAGQLLGLPLPEGLTLGVALGIASTVVVLRVFEDRRELKTEAGRIAIGWLVVQDLVAVVAVVLLPILNSRGDLGVWASAGLVAQRLLMIAVFVALMFVVGGRVLPWLLVRIAHTRSRELFTLGVLTIALGIGWLADAAFGASSALGAFVAGLVINGSPLGHNAAERSLPLRDAFAVLFFVSVGMLFDPKLLLQKPLALAMVLGVVLTAGIVAALAVGFAARIGRARTLLLAATLPQVGEFSFVLGGLAVGRGLLAPSTQGLIIGAAILSIALNPLLIWIASALQPREAEGSTTGTPAPM